MVLIGNNTWYVHLFIVLIFFLSRLFPCWRNTISDLWLACFENEGFWLTYKRKWHKWPIFVQRVSPHVKWPSTKIRHNGHKGTFGGDGYVYYLLCRCATTSVCICQTHQIVSIRHVPFVLIWMRSLKWKKNFDWNLNKDYVNLPANAGNTGDAGLIPEWGRSSGEGNDNPLQYFLSGKLHGQRSLMGYSPWGCKESDIT